MPTRRRKPRTPPAPALFAPPLLWAEFARRSAEMMVAATQVVSERTQRMAQATPVPNARDRREFALMGREKVEAAGESAAALQRGVLAMPWSAGLRCWQDAFTLSSAALRLGTSRTPAEAIARATTLSKTAAAAGKRAATVSSAGARLASSTMEPLARRATANAKRLRRG